MNRSQRAHQLWSILVLASKNRQILTYSILGKATGLPAAAIGSHLLPIQTFCEREGLPKLTILVVNKETGHPGAGLQVVDFPREVQEVFEFDWLAYKAPGSEVGPNSEDFE